ncbi:MAG: hypothetical protein ACREK7_06090 [Gemmatimonadota bacterium]
MNVLERLRTCLLLCGLMVALPPMPGLAQSASDSSAEPRDGQRDFDFEIGTWRTQLKLLQDPLSGSTTWIEYEGTTVVREVLDGRANLVELDVQGQAGRIEGLSLRLYNPETRQWSLNFASARNGILTPPVYGSFENGRGTFYGLDTLDGRAILVRFVISDITEASVRFEQAFSDDGGETWEVNWIATDTLVESESGTTR